MQGVLLKLELNNELQQFTGGIRGEVIMTHKVHKNFYADKANCRNAANGLMKRKDGIGCEHLNFICYDAFFENHSFTDEEDKIKWLKKIGFETVPLKICTTPSDVIDYRASVMDIRSSLAYDIDGLVIKERKIDINDAFKARPDKQIAFKFSLEEAVSVLQDIEWSESGATYTPVGIFNAVELAGTTVKRASLVNPNTIRKLGIKIGSHIILTKRGEIIPKIESVVPEETIKNSNIKLKDIEFPAKCSKCGTALKDEGTRLFCPNKECPKRILHRLEKWISVLDIRDLGITLIKNLFYEGLVKSVKDLYELKETDLITFFLTEESLLKEKKSLGAEKVIKSIKKRKSISLETLIAGFDIEGIGETLMEKLTSAGFNTLEKLLAANEREIANISGFGIITANTLVQGLKENILEIQYLLDKGYIEIKNNLAGIFSGKSFCFTGELSIKRSEAEKIVKENGGAIKSSVVKDLSYLVTNDTSSGSSKNKKAAELNIPVINEKEFFALLEKQS